MVQFEFYIIKHPKLPIFVGLVPLQVIFLQFIEKRATI